MLTEEMSNLTNPFELKVNLLVLELLTISDIDDRVISIWSLLSFHGTVATLS